MSKPSLRNRLKSRRGAATLEYGLLIALVAMVVIAALLFTGYGVREIFDRSAVGIGNVLAEEPAPEVPANHPPVAVDVTLSGETTLGEVRVVAPGELLQAASDPDGDDLDLALGSASSGNLSFEDSFIAFKPDAEGLESFTFTVSDGRGGSDEATAFLVVLPPNGPPVAGNVTLERVIYTTSGQRAYSFSEMLANASDPDGDTLSVDVAGDYVNGTAFVIDETVLFVAAGLGSASFSYTVSDGVNDPVTATASLEVKTPTICGAWQDNVTVLYESTIQSWSGLTAEQCLAKCEATQGATGCQQTKASGNCTALGGVVTATGSTSFRGTFCSPN